MRSRTSRRCERPWKRRSLQIDRASVTISAILRVSAVENGARQNRFKDFDLGAVCAEVAEFYRAARRNQGHRDGRGGARSRADARRRGSDARSDLEPHRQRHQVHARGRQGAGRGRDGRGSAAPGRQRQRPRRSRRRIAVQIFRRFYRGEGAQNASGHGLGLSIAQTIANLHGFQLRWRTTPRARASSCAPTAKASLGLARAAE